MKSIFCLALVVGLTLLAGCGSGAATPTAEPAPAESVSPSPSVAPALPKGVVERDLTLNEGSEWALSAKLSLPESASGKLPAVILVHGSGPSDMDETAYGVTPFRDIAHGLSKRGIAVLRYDKRTYTHGKRMSEELGESITVKEESMDDAIAAAALLRGDPRIDEDRVFLLGHSLGATLVPRIDAMDGGHFAGIIMLAGTARPLWEVSYDQNMDYIKDKDDITKSLAKAQLEPEMKKAENLLSMTDEEAKTVQVFGQSGLYWKSTAVDLPIDMLRKTKTPALILQGSEDWQVSPKKDFEAMEQALSARKDTEFKLYDGLNHMFSEGDPDYKGTVQEYEQHATVRDDCIDDIAEFIISH